MHHTCDPAAPSHFDMKNYYAILEVPVGCPVTEVREAYRRLVQENLWNKEAFSELKEAYEVLTTATRRNEYDKATFGETFPDTGGDAPLGVADVVQVAAARHCPMGAAVQCPVVSARVPLQETYCPECGFLLASMSAQEFEPVALPDRAHLPRLEDGAGRQFPLQTGPNIVGREAADVLLPDKTVSRRHAQLLVSDDGMVSVEDFDSTNGTRIEGSVVSVGMTRAVPDGAHVQFGSVDMRLRMPTALKPAALPLPQASVPAPAPPQASAPASPLPPHAPSPSALARLVSIRGGAKREFPLVPGVTTFGRRSENSVVLGGDPYISGHHAQIIAEGDTFRLTDLGSTNGTLVNGQALTANMPRPLLPGDEVILGSMAYRFERGTALGSPDTPAAPPHALAEDDNAPLPLSADAASDPAAAPSKS